MSIWNREPVVVSGLVAAIINVLIAFGVPIDTELKAAILTLVNAALLFLARSAVTPVADPRPATP